MKSSLRDRLGTRVQVRDVDRVQYGSAVDIVLRKAATGDLRPVGASLALAKRGLSLLRAKRAIEVLRTEGMTSLHLPKVEDLRFLASELSACGIAASAVMDAPVDVRSIRNDLGMTQEQFGLLFNIDVSVVRNWEQGRTSPDRTARSYLRVIRRLPQQASRAQEVQPVPPQATVAGLENPFGEANINRLPGTSLVSIGEKQIGMLHAADQLTDYAARTLQKPLVYELTYKASGSEFSIPNLYQAEQPTFDPHTRDRCLSAVERAAARARKAIAELAEAERAIERAKHPAGYVLVQENRRMYLRRSMLQSQSPEQHLTSREIGRIAGEAVVRVTRGLAELKS
jgi:DNA-binding transcriptional regulator YiaG